MVSKIETKQSLVHKPALKAVEVGSLNYCSDCIYHWCTKKSKVVFCTLKTKGLFECKSCMIKLIERYS
jgi:hypothetical protein